jgi:hypothetical protein
MTQPRSTPQWWLAAIPLAGIPLGLLWWVLAPTGVNLLSGDPELASGTNPDGWLPRDLVLAGLFLFAGCLTGVLLSGKGTYGPGIRNLVLAIAAGALGAVIAWRVGMLAGEWWGRDEDTSANASIAFSLRSYSVLLIWPAATALAVFVVNLTSLLRRAPDAAD